ncbi:ABC transporter substrate-binding protein [Mesorhizobium sp. M2E.F.Ca.ET.219.01.1.1]|uniref:ABC transporter substrate-binding protein n=2 Tax=Mesorhizobium TaxID=68287 RepID=UPI000FD7F09A|nr:ABC transporter substrate-binding protein [Mesorhizobium sp. M2E.F.Ca.ET.219.01.1.1]TGQ04858.1 ABC transporter substrate-binding protein [Mesorhizobium sp. M2E.F.Ca.ET.219.01.1.1]
MRTTCSREDERMDKLGVAEGLINRRKLLGLASGAAAAGIGLALPELVMAAPFEGLVERARQAGERQVVVAGGTGAYGDLVKKHFYLPFTEATGIEVVPTGGGYGEKLAKLKAMTSVGKVEWDVITLSIDSLTPDVTSLLRDLGDCAGLPDVASQGVDGSCLREGVMFDIGGGVLAFDKRSFPEGQAQPAGWADFWNVKAFPGPRALPNIGNPWWALIAALEADGVSRDALFPLDIDRAFRKLDEIKPHVTVWWKSGDQSQQIFRTGEVVMAMLFSGRAFRLRGEGIPLGISWNGAPLDAAFWAVTKAAQHPNAALALLDFIYTRPKAHAEFAAESFGSTAQRGALDFLTADAKASSVLQPANWSNIVRVDREWLAANREKVLQRWSMWIAS